MTQNTENDALRWQPGMKAGSNRLGYDAMGATGPLWGSRRKSAPPALKANGAPSTQSAAAWTLSLASPALLSNILTRALNEGTDAHWDEWLGAATPYLEDLARRASEWRGEWLSAVALCLSEPESSQQRRFAQWMGLMEPFAAWRAPRLDAQAAKALSATQQGDQQRECGAWIFGASQVLAGGARGPAALYWAKKALEAFASAAALEESSHYQRKPEARHAVHRDRLAFFLEAAAQSGALGDPAAFEAAKKEILLPQRLMSRENFEAWWPLGGAACAGPQAFALWLGEAPLHAKRMSGRLARVAAKEKDPQAWARVEAIVEAFSIDREAFLAECANKSKTGEFAAWAEQRALRVHLGACAAPASEPPLGAAEAQKDLSEAAQEKNAAKAARARRI